MIFKDRAEAGAFLAGQLYQLRGADAIVLGLPRGGVPVAYEVAARLGLPLDVFIVRKIGVPGHEELAMGAIASGGIAVVNDDVVRLIGIDQRTFDAVAAQEQRELQRRELLYRANRPPLQIIGKSVIVVDDGIATGASMRAAIVALRTQAPAQLIVAAPVASPSVYQQFADLADRVVCVQTPEDFSAVGAWYESFPQTSDAEVRHLLSVSNAA